jgi:hypothetical protein
MTKMETMVVVAFSDASGADFGATLLRAMEGQGVIRIRAMAVLGRNAAGRLTARHMTEGGRHARSVQVIARALRRAVEPRTGRGRRGEARAQRGRNASSRRVRSGVDISWLRIAIGTLRQGGAVVIASLREQRVSAVDLPMELSDGIVLRQTRGSILGTLLRACGVIWGNQTADASRITARAGARWMMAWLRTKFAPVRVRMKTPPADARNSDDVSRIAELTSRDLALGLARASNRRIRRRPG